MSYELVEEFIPTFKELHNRFPNREVVFYDWLDGEYYFNGGMIYAIADEGDCSSAITQFKSDHPDKKCRSIPTSPVDEEDPSFLSDINSINRKFEIIEEFIPSFEELCKRFPNSEVLVYNCVEGDYLFNGGIVYAVAPTLCADLADRQFDIDHPNTVLSHILTSPDDDRDPFAYLEL